jgi:ABC-type sugar transport system substrate-binding protein
VGGIDVVFLNPADESDPFWKMTTDFLLASAEDLNIEVEIIYSSRNHILIVEQAQEVVHRSRKPDYLLIGNEKGSAQSIIELAQQAGVKVFLFNNGFIEPIDMKKFGKPRLHYPVWIGQLIPNNYSAGYQIATHLIQEAKARGTTDAEGKLKLAALAGAFYTHSSRERVRGLQDAVKEYSDDVELVQVIPGDWSEKTAELKSKLMFSRYKDIGAVWGANDVTVFGAITSAKMLGKKPGQDILFGGCGWYPPAIERVKQGTIVTTVGGHFMDGAWALVLLHDYHHGKDFIDEEVKSEMYSIDSSNVAKYLDIFGEQKWNKIDFSRFSKVLNQNLQKYNFSLETVLQQFQ